MTTTAGQTAPAAAPPAPKAGLWKRLARERLAVALLVAAALIGGIALIPDPSMRGLRLEQYNRLRASWHQCADVVLLGDSRVMTGVSPAILRRHMGDLRICNFALAGTGHSDKSLQRAHTILDPHSRRPIVVMGITAVSLRGNERGVDVLEGEDEQIRGDGPVDRFLATLSRPFEHKSFKTMLAGLKGRRDVSFKDFRPDGWAAVNDVPNRPRSEVKRYRKALARPVPLEEGMERIARYVRRWRSEGVRVYAFRPPTNAGMIEVENTVGGYDQARIVRLFEQAGGVWIDVPQTKYACYDGSHLRYDGAEEFSHDLGKLLAQAEAKRDDRSETPDRDALGMRDP